MSCQEQFLKQLRARGLRLTPQREMVLSVMHELDGHASTEEIFQRVQAISSAVDISTVYRTLELLSGLGLLNTLDGPGVGRQYALTLTHGEHIHLVCSECGQVFPAEMGPVRDLATALLDSAGFRLDAGRLSLTGLCRDCAAAALS